jgi:hypothetical protein
MEYFQKTGGVLRGGIMGHNTQANGTFVDGVAAEYFLACPYAKECCRLHPELAFNVLPFFSMSTLHPERPQKPQGSGSATCARMI